MRLPGSSSIHITTVTMTGGHEDVKVLVQNVTNANNFRILDPRLEDAVTVGAGTAKLVALEERQVVVGNLEQIPTAKPPPTTCTGSQFGYRQ
jgi:ribulose kinase